MARSLCVVLQRVRNRFVLQGAVVYDVHTFKPIAGLSGARDVSNTSSEPRKREVSIRDFYLL
jgi:hypothetical protein